MKNKASFVCSISWGKAAWAALCGAVGLAQAVSGAERQILQYKMPPTTNAASIKREVGWKPMKLAIGLPLQNKEELAGFIERLYDPASPDFRHYLTPGQFAERFGPKPADYQALIAFVRSHGLRVIATYPNRALLDVEGLAPSIEQTFQVKLKTYQHPTEPRTFFAPDTPPSLDLDVPLLSVSGLDDYYLPHALYHKWPPERTEGKPIPQSGAGPNGSYMGNDFRAAYVPGVTLNGTGQTVGLLEFDGFYASDITRYKNEANLPDVPVVKVLLDGFSGSAGGANVEVALDIDMAISMAPGVAEVLVYEGERTDSILNRIATDNLAKQISASWSYTIDAASQQAFLQMAAQGQSFYNASGDSDAYSGVIPTPCDDTNITIVGGTTLTTSGPGGAWVSEKVWNWGGGTGSSGGISTRYTIPPWQQGISMAANQGSTTHRNIPDVAMTADNVFVIADNGRNLNVGGTSCAAPLWAGFTALANQLAAANGEPPVGFINPAVYAIGKGLTASSYVSNFHDIVTGNNENSSSPSKFVAVAGYDLCTGWGTPTGITLLSTLALPEPLRISPNAGTLISGPAGGPFSPLNATYSLTNDGATALTWAVSAIPSWLSVSSQGGTLPPNRGTITLSLGLTSAASNLVAGSYSATLLFTNLSDRFGQSRQVTLAVVTPPIIASQPTNQAVLELAPAIFSVGTGSNALLYYRWQLNGTSLTDGSNFIGTATSSLTVSNALPSVAGSYSVVVSNAAGMAVSSNALLTIVPSQPVVTMQPTNQTVLPGSSTSLSVAAIGTLPFTYVWQVNGTNLHNGSSISGVATSTLTISNVSAANAGTYTVLVKNTLGSTTSTGAVLAVIPVTLPGFNLSSLSSFVSTSSGEFPYSPLAPTRSGALYGTALEGGANGYGTVFRVTTNGTVSTLFAFNYSDGGFPYAGLVEGRDGLLYGATYEGGTYGNGEVFKMTTNGVQTLAVAFNGINGELPVGGLVQGTDGNFYGTTLAGGLYGNGTLYRITSSGGRTTLVSLDSSEGIEPSSVLVQGVDGNFYGTTEFGGTNGSAGTVFKMTPAGKLTTLYAFTGGDDGAVPIPGLAVGADGNFYGTTIEGGSNNVGTVFRITPSGTLTTLYTFAGDDGANPWGGLVQSTDGNLYGTTENGGAYGFGTIFSLAPNGPFTTVAQFDGYNGATPAAALAQAGDGNLYGTTSAGGSSGAGTVFRLSIAGALRITSQPADQAAFVGGNARFTVATFGSQPVAYQWQRDGTNLSDGGEISGSATAALTLTNVSFADAAVYSVIVSNSFGSVASDEAVLEVILSPPEITSQPAGQSVVTGEAATFTVAASGSLPLSYQWQVGGTNLSDGGQVAGSSTSTLTLGSVTAANAGTYSVIVSNALAAVRSAPALLIVTPAVTPGVALNLLHLFADGTDGAFPSSALIQARDGNLYGTASGGGTAYSGAMFRMNLNGTLVSLYSFPGGTNAATPYDGLAQASNNYFYGTTSGGGINGYGTIFRAAPGGSPVVALYSFSDGADGAFPYAGLVQGKDGNLYGTAFQGGANGYGSVFRLTQAATVTPLYSFNDADDGAYPYAGLVQGVDGNLYGTAAEGGANGLGTVFRITASGSLTVLAAFDSTNGALPEAGLVQGADGSFYGTTSSGGSNGFGTVFQITTNGMLTSLVSFNDTNGAEPVGALVQGTDGNLYGTTATGGVGGAGTVFKITTNGVLTTLLWFDGLNGANPAAALLQANNGSFYGTTAYGGANYDGTPFSGLGTVFKLTVPLFINNHLALSSATAGLPYANTIASQAITPAGDTLTFAKISGPTWLNVDPSGTLSGSPTSPDIGTNTFVVQLTDTNGVSASTTLSLQVLAPVPPSFVANPFTVSPVNFGQAVSLNLGVEVLDPNVGDTLNFALVSGPAWLNVATNGVVSGTPGLSDVGTNAFVISFTDALGFTSNATMLLEVYGPPTFATDPFTGPPGAVGYTYSGSIAASASDPNAGNTLRFALVSGPAWLSVDSSGMLSGTPGTVNAGTNQFVVSAADSGGGLTTHATMYLYVYTPPGFTSSPFAEPSAVSGLPYGATIATNAVDPDAGIGDTLTFSKISGPAWLSVAPNGVLSGSPPLSSPPGLNSFTVRVADSIGAATAGLMRILVISNIPPSFLANPFQEPFAKAGLDYTNTISTNAFEVNVGDPLAFSKVSGPAWLTVVTNGTLSGVAAASDAGTNTFVVSVTDYAGLSNLATMTLEVHGPPTFSTNWFAEPWANLDQPFTGAITNVSDVDSGALLIFSKLSGPPWISVATNGALSGTPDLADAGGNTFVVGVTDFGGLTNSATVYLYVNSPPSFEPMSFVQSTAVSGLPYSATLATNATDPDLVSGDTLTFYKVTGPAWLNVATNGALSGTPGPADVGLNPFLVLVVDSGGLSGVGLMSIPVQTDTPPTFVRNPFSAPLAHAGQPYVASIASQAVDTDPGDTLSLAKAGGPAWLNIAANGALSGLPSRSDVGTNTFVVRAADTAGLSATATMFVTVIPSLDLSIAQSGSMVILSWTGGSPPYQVQTCSDFSGAGWQNLGSPLSTNTLMLNPTNAAGWFRVGGL